MSSRTLLNLALAAVTLILGLLVYFKPGLEPEPTPQPLTAVADSDTVSHIEVERLAREPLAFSKRDNRWYLLTVDHALPASQFQLRALLQLPQAIPAASYPAATLPLQDLGLQPPQASVTLGATTILLGATEPLKNRRYALLGDSVHLLEDRYQHLINADWSNFIERKLLPADKAISRLQLPELTLALSDDNEWQQEPAGTAISSTAIQQLLDNWDRATALYARRYDNSRASTGTVRVEFSDASTPLTFAVLSHTPELVLARPDWGIQYHLQGEMSAGLFSLAQAGSE
jgi:hypothetical protein